MSRILKRVPLDFSWPYNKVWGGYLNPYYRQAGVCPDCTNGYDRKGGTLRNNAAVFNDQWYGNGLIPFRAEKYGADPLRLDSPWIRQAAQHNVERSPGFFMTDEERLARSRFKRGVLTGVWGLKEQAMPVIPFPEFDRNAAIEREALRLWMMWKWQWCHQLIQADVDALVAADRLWEFTKRPRTAEQAQQLAEQEEGGKSGYWLEEPNGHVVTAEEVNAWSILSSGHDDHNRYICVKARCQREGVPLSCLRCGGDGRSWPSEEIKKKYETWEPEEPPEGKGYQLWENCSEGSPVGPVFETLDQLCEWAEENATTFASNRTTKERWREMLDDGLVYATDEKGNIFL